jgi:Fic family protein
MATYIWECGDWPNLMWDANSLLSPLADARHRQGLFLGKMRDIGIDARLEAELTALSEDVVTTSAIEGEVLNPASVRSSIARRLGIPDAGLAPTDRKVEGVVDIVMDATKNDAAPLTAERIFGWHAALFPTGYSGKDKIDVAQWRTDRLGAMQVVSNVYSPTPTVHFEAPPARRVPDEMAVFLEWFNSDRQIDPLLRAGLAHLWFVTIHPMDDGNGRIARAVADLAIARAERTGQRFYSMSGAIERDKKRYYDMLEATQKGDLDITEWLLWFTECYTRAITTAETVTDRVVTKAKFWRAHDGAPPFSDRQRKVLSKLLDGFEGHITSRKWASISKCSPDTALRDINDLVGRGLLIRNPGGSKNTSFTFDWPPEQPHTADHNGAGRSRDSREKVSE